MGTQCIHPKILFITLLISFSLTLGLKAQTEQASFFADKKVCLPGDTIWLRIFLRDTVHTTSTNFYVELYSDKNTDTTKPIRRYLFPVKDGISMGQIETPDSAGIYWLRGYTLNSKNELIYPFTIIDNPRKVAVKELLDKTQQENINTNMVSYSRDTSGIYIHIDDPEFSNYSISITNAENPDVSVPYSRIVSQRNSSISIDSAYLSYSISARDLKFANQDVVIVLQKDTTMTTPQLISLDNNASLSLNNLYFFDSAFIYYKLNNNKRSKDAFNLDIDTLKYPPFKLPLTSVYKTENIGMFGGNDSIPFIIGKRTLKTFVVKSKWKDRNLELNKRYVMSSQFEPIEQFAFDLRDPEITTRYSSLYDLMSRTLPKGWARNSLGFMTGSCREGVLYYEDERRVNGQYLNAQPLNRYAYFKAYSDLQPCPCIVIYTRKGNDLKALPSQMKTLALKGYDKPLQWTSPDRITYHWNPFITDAYYKFKIPAKKFRLQIMGVKQNGSSFFYNDVIDEENIAIGTAINTK
ncbi:hypothetical protein [Chitinophaga sp.]|uniref:hypothetical protein n=1 Tax=Chitinophaga sp. TaxID=1869181 RepID=UPI0031D1E296